MRIPATVVIGDHTQGLGILRSAAAAGGKAWVINDKTLSLARFSRHLSGYRRIRWGALGQLSQPHHSELLLRELLALPVEYPSLLFGVNEDITHFIHTHAKLLRQKYFIPDVRLDRIYDKYVFNLLLPESARIATRLCSETEIMSLENPRRYILKGRQGNGFRRLTGQKAIRLDQLSQAQSVTLFNRLSPHQVMIQEVVETDRPVLSVCSFSVSGRIWGVFQYEKLRQHPNQFGTGTYLRSTWVGSLMPLAAEILKSLDFTGISEIECIFDASARRYKVIEMNPRAWKSIHFATRCGQNLVGRYLLYVATGRTSLDDKYHRDQYWVDLATDIPQMIREWMPRRYHRGVFECTWDSSDRRPALALWTLFPLIALENALSSRVATATIR